MKHLFVFLLALLLPLAAAAETRLMVVSDTHFLAPELYEGSPLFLRVMERGDGKRVQNSRELLDALLLQARRIRPDALVLTGDLAFNGEKASHVFLADSLRTLQEDGIPIFVLPGNHDIQVASAAAFSGETYSRTESVSAAEFRAIYGGMTGDSPAGTGISGVVRLPDSPLSLLLLDCAYYEPEAQVFGLADPARMAWAAESAGREKAAGRTVISFTHHSLIPHTSLWEENFAIWNHARLAGLLREAGVRLHFSGHLHIQHIVSEDGLTDVASGAFSVYPHRYGLLTLGDDGSLSYAALPLDEDLLPPGFMEESRTFFENTTRLKLAPDLAGLGLPESDTTLLLDFAARLNTAYFSGTLASADAEAWHAEPGYALCLRLKDRLPFAQYLDLVLSEASEDALRYPAIP